MQLHKIGKKAYIKLINVIRDNKYDDVLYTRYKFIYNNNLRSFRFISKKLCRVRFLKSVYVNVEFVLIPGLKAPI